MDIGEAMKALKNGKKVSRKGWNGKNMYILYVEGISVSILESKSVGPSIALRTPDGGFQPGWNASTPDLLSLDWGIVE